MAGDFDFTGISDFGTGLGQDISQYTSGPSSSYSPSTLSTSVGPALSVGGDAGGGDWMSQISGYAQQALPLLKLGTQGLGAYTGIKGVVDAGQQRKFLTGAERTSQQIAQPAAASAGQLIPAGTSAMLGGPLPANLEATAANWTNAAKARLRQFFAHAGITDSTMIAQAEAQIDAQAQELRAKLAQGLLSGGQGVGGLGIQGAQLEGNLAMREGDTINAALQEANASLMRMIGMTG